MRRTSLLALLLLLPADPLLACSCAPATLESSWEHAHRIFTGRVVEKHDRANVFRKAWGFLLDLTDRDLDMHEDMLLRGYRYEFAVDQVFRGQASKRTYVFTGRGGGDCGVNFEVGRSYLVYAYCDDDGDCSTYVCSRSRPLAHAAEDLAYLKQR